MKKLLTTLFAALTLCSPVAAWDIKEMNEHIDQTNFIVDRGCSGTLIDIEDRLILTNHHCVDKYIRFKQEEVVSPRGVVSDGS